MHIDFLRGSDICLDKKVFTFNEKSTENWSLPSEIDYEINFVMEQTSVIAEKMSFFKDTYCKVESREVHF